MKKDFLLVKKIFFAAVCLMFISSVNSYSQEMAVPAGLQAALFKKIFAFDKTLQSKGNIEVAILSGDDSGEEVANAFKASGINAKVVSGTQIPSGSTVVYMMPGASSPKAQTSQKKILSISGVTSYVESGKVAIGLGVEGGKPKININMSQLKAEGQELSADLLKIAKVIQ